MSKRKKPTPAPTLPPAKHERADDLAGLPAPHPEDYTPHELNTPGRWLVLSDIHAPYHDRATLEAAVAEAKRRGVVGVLLNGDTLDSHEVSRHDKDPSAPRYVEEIDIGKKLLAWVRVQFPRAELVLKEGNHEERLTAYVLRNAPALFGLDGLDLPSLLRFAEVGATWVTGRRVVALGKLNVVHGHEFGGGVGSPVSPARGLLLRARSVAMCGHHHQSSEANGRTIRQQQISAWSTGCACFLHPRYMPLNQWNHGFAFVEVSSGGEFSVENRRVRNGRLE